MLPKEIRATETTPATSTIGAILKRNGRITRAAVDIPSFLGNFNVSALQRFDSGSAYSLSGAINPTSEVEPEY